jgi:hypothetical protein
MWAEPAQKGLDKLHKYMEQGGEPYYILVELENLRDFYEVTRKDAKDFIDWYQKEIVKDVLTMIAAPFDYDIKPYVLMLRRLGADWRELDVIEDSINRGHLRENRYGEYRTRYVAQHEPDIMSAFQRNILSGINRLWFYSIKADEIERVEDMIEEHKGTLIKLILTYLREGDMTDYGTAKGIIIKLQDSGIAWPELDVALRSILKAFDDNDRNYD